MEPPSSRRLPFSTLWSYSEKRIDQVKLVVSGAGAAGIACASLYLQLGVKKENMFLVDSKGLVYKGRKEGMNPYKERFANGERPMSLAEVMKGADVFAGFSVAGLVSKEMVRSMAERPIIFALANPDPEISYHDAISVRSDLIMATGRSDFPNQVNNVLGFPYIFRGALDVSAIAINDEMKIAAVRALADLAKEDVPDSVLKAYGKEYAGIRAKLYHSQAVRPARAHQGSACSGKGGS